MAVPRYHYLASLYSAEGSLLSRLAITPDWYPATEAARFRALRQCRSNALPGPARIQPIWDTETGAPLTAGVRAIVTDGEDREVTCEVGITYFKAQLQGAAADLIRTGKLQEGDTYQYVVHAIAAADSLAQPVGATALQWDVEDVSETVLSGQRPLRDLIEVSTPYGDDPDLAPAQEDYPVFIPRAVLMAAEQLKEAAGENETGGILIGHLWRDTDTSEIYAEITGLVPARHTVEKSTSLRFTAQTWDAVQQAIALRNRGESWIGWYHTHPSRYWCKCDPESQKHCPLGEQFFSNDDLTVHRTVFSRGFHIALVTGDRPRPEGGWEMVHALYGWRDGSVQSRNFYLTGETLSAAAELAAGHRSSTNGR